MVTLRVAGAALFLLTLASCSKKSAEEYRLSAEQLAWQPYHVGDELRFGHSRDSKVRTYRITEVQDAMEEQFTGLNLTPFPSKEPPRCQHLEVMAQRTDTISQAQPVLNLQLFAEGGDAVQLRAEAGWETFYSAKLPVNEAIKGLAIDTAAYEFPGTTLLPMATLGPTSYQKVIRVDNRRATGMPPLTTETRRLYYARTNGVVAFREANGDLWYRLP